MSLWGKIIGGVAGFAMGGPFGAVVGAALGHAADEGTLPQFGQGATNGGTGVHHRMAGMLGGRDQAFAIGVVVLAAKLSKCDGPVNRAEIDAFKRHFRIQPQAARNVGRLFDQARHSAGGFEPYAQQLGETFSDNRGVLEDVLTAFFAIAAADGAVNGRETDFLTRVHRAFGLTQADWDRARGGTPRARRTDEPDPYAALGISRGASDEAVRAAWRQLMRDNHPDSLAARGVPPEFIARASEKVARINAAWDRIKRERGL